MISPYGNLGLTSVTFLLPFAGQKPAGNRMYYKQPILAHRNGGKRGGRRKVLWLAIAAAIPGFGVVAAFGVAPDTLVEPVRIERIVQEVALPPALADSNSDTGVFSQEGRIQRGDTVAELLVRLQVDDAEAVAFLRGAKDLRALTQLRPGRNVWADTDASGRLLGLRYLTHGAALFSVVREGSEFKASEQPVQLEAQPLRASGSIRSSLFAATDAADLPDAIAIQIAEIFSSQIDFHRDLRRGDRFAVVYEGLYYQGELVKTGRVLAAEFVNDGKTHQAVWFETGRGEGSYYTADGRSMRKAFLRSPLEFSRISSGFTAARFHPILQKWRAHRGIDYAAPTGTRVRSTGDGVVKFMGRQGGYGNLVIVQHTGGYETYYAHLSAFDSGLRKGAHVGQGEYVGYVGQTGMATGPHLQYEFHIRGVQHDPLRVTLPEAVPITRDLRPAFDAHAEPLVRQIELMRQVQTARIE
jgi:murein DD-endopeptidase MepM/ murein hydrolase activator NlpD